MPLTITITPSSTRADIVFLWITDEHTDADAVPVWPLGPADLQRLIDAATTARDAMRVTPAQPLPYNPQGDTR